MPNSKTLIIPLSVIVLIGALALPVFALEYNPGVKTGQYVKYGNFVGTGTGVESFNDYSWSKLEVTDVSGKEVTLLSTGQFKDGTAIPANGTKENWDKKWRPKHSRSNHRCQLKPRRRYSTS